MVFVSLVMKTQLVRLFTYNMTLVSMNALNTLNLLMDDVNLTALLVHTLDKESASLVPQDVQNVNQQTFALCVKIKLTVI